jgi:hypothetical protein
MAEPFRDRNGVTHERELRWALAEYDRCADRTGSGASTTCTPL